MPTSLPTSGSKQSQVSQQQDELFSVIELVDKALEELETRLASILRSEDATKEASKKEQEPKLVPLAEFIYLRIQSLKAIVIRLEDLRSRIEL